MGEKSAIAVTCTTLVDIIKSTELVCILLIGTSPIGRFVHRQRRRAAIIEKINRCRRAVVVGGDEGAAEVRDQINAGPVEGSNFGLRRPGTAL